MILWIIYWAFFALILARIILRMGPEYWQWQPLGRLILRLTDPLLAPFSRIARPIEVTPQLTVDFAPMLFLCSLYLLITVLRMLKINF